MLSLLALTYTAARLGFEAQNAAAFRLLRLAGGISKRAADEIIPGEIIPKAMVSPIDVAPEPVRVAPKRRHAAKKVHKKSAAVRKRRKRG